MLIKIPGNLMIKANQICFTRRFAIAIVPVLLLLQLNACQEKVNWELEMENDLQLVVEGKISNEQKAHEVRLSLPSYEINGETQPVRDAEVFISDGDTVIQLAHDNDRPGIYATSNQIRGVVNKTYGLLIKLRGFEFTARAKMEAVTPIQAPDYNLVNEEPPLYEAYFSGSDEPSRITLEMDWSHLPGYDSLSEDMNHAVIYGYYFSPLTFDVNEFFSPTRDRVYFPPGTIVTIKKESLSRGYEEFLRGMLSETAWNGGLFDVKPGDPYTNLSNGAIGYFAATTVIRDTIVFNP